jgi:hypothetical protein
MNQEFKPVASPDGQIRLICCLQIVVERTVGAMRTTTSRLCGASLIVLLMVLNSGGQIRRHVAKAEDAEANVAPLTAGPQSTRTIPSREEGIEEQVSSFCGACHALPTPASFPKSAWRREVDQGYKFYLQSRRRDLVVPVQEKTVAFFKNRAPDKLALPGLPADGEGPHPGFRREHLRIGGEPQAPAIAHLHALRLEKDGPQSLVYCDVSRGEIGTLSPASKPPIASVLARLSYPCHVELCDLDRDGVLDLVVADLGTFEPADHALGRVVWLRRKSTETQEWEATVLRSGLGRVAAVEPGDFDGDGDTDLIVAEFGYHSSGRVLLLRNLSGSSRQVPRFDLEVIDPRHGAIHVPAIDLDGDGRLDFVALFGQEHEMIEAFLNSGDGKFRRETIYAAQDPTFGSTGIQVIDLDGDGDLDILYSNGDAMDSYYARPRHGLQWLENMGRYPFECHRLTDLPGVLRALAADLDGDGLLDVVAASYLSDKVLANSPGAEFDSLILLKQHVPGKFTRHRIETGNLRHMALELFDADEDGDIDIFTGNFSGGEGHTVVGPRITAWWNEGTAR